MANPLSSVPVHCASSFSWNGLMGTAEASDFRDRKLFGRVYADAADQGMILVSPKTGNRVLFTLVDESRNDEGELIALHFSGSKDPASVFGFGLQLTILND